MATLNLQNIQSTVMLPTLRWFQSITIPQNYSFWLSVFVLGYLVLVQLLRFRNLRKLNKNYARYLNDPSSMDYKTAHEILKVVLLQEFPFTYAFGTQWALVKSYSIASGTKLLVQTRRLASVKTVGRRSEDTGVILAELLISGIDTDRGLRALSKMNWIHKQYGFKIGNGELIHTLALFVLEPQRWIEMYEWRPMSQLEKVAAFVYWKEIGNRMGMTELPQTLEELKTWTTAFEAGHRVYAESNKSCTIATINLFLRNVPHYLHGFAYDVAAAFIEEDVRPMLGLHNPPQWVSLLVDSVFITRAWCIRHLALPRFYPLDPMAKERSDGRLYRESWIFEPWYVPETFMSRLQKMIFGTSKPIPGPDFKSNGYLPEELGPIEYEKSSRDAVLKQAFEMKKYADEGGAAVLGCPFAFAR